MEEKCKWCLCLCHRNRGEAKGTGGICFPLLFQRGAKYIYIYITVLHAD